MFSNNDLHLNKIVSSEQSTQEASAVSTYSSYPFNEAIIIENNISNAAEAPITLLKNYFKSSLLKSKEYELLSINSLIDHLLNSDSIEIQFKKTDISFPFHTFL